MSVSTTRRAAECTLDVMDLHRPVCDSHRLRSERSGD
jgi:hypothetical protein